MDVGKSSTNADAREAATSHKLATLSGTVVMQHRSFLQARKCRGAAIIIETLSPWSLQLRAL